MQLLGRGRLGADELVDYSLSLRRVFLDVFPFALSCGLFGAVCACCRLYR